VTAIDDLDWVADLAIAPDGTIVVLARAESRSLVLRFTADGVLDHGFGDGGFVDLDTLGIPDAWATSLRVVPGGSVLVGGLHNWGARTGFVLRLGPVGERDASYGDSGLATFSGIWDLADLEPADGGQTLVSLWVKDGVEVAQLNPDGTLDRSFGRRGFAAFDYRAQQRPARPVAMDTSRKDDIVVGVYAMAKRKRHWGNFGAVRFDSDGTVERNFGDRGLRMVDFGAEDEPESIAVDRHDRILIGGGAGDATFEAAKMALVRLTAKGGVDRSFGRDGTVLRGMGSSNYANDVLVERSGRVLVVGSGYVGNVEDVDTDLELDRFVFYAAYHG
jgi:uncharacterized delta-60 repeat protein